MSFVKTLATLAVGFAAAKGYDKFKDMGGMAGVQKAMQDNPQMQGMSDQMGAMMSKLGIPGAENMKSMMDQFMGQGQAAAGSASANAAAGLGGLISAMPGAGAAGATQAAGMMDAMTGTSAATDAMEANAKLMIRAMIQAAKVDGEIDDEERARILEHLGDLDAEEMEFVQAELDRPLDIQGLANDTGSAMKEQVYATSLMAVRVDSTEEVRYLDGLAAALGLDDDTRRRIHKSMGLG